MKPIKLLTDLLEKYFDSSPKEAQAINLEIHTLMNSFNPKENKIVFVQDIKSEMSERLQLCLDLLLKGKGIPYEIKDDVKFDLISCFRLLNSSSHH